jgi:hypothetical protein
MATAFKGLIILGLLCKATVWSVVFWVVAVWICCLVFTCSFYLGLAVLAPRARYSFATAQKSTQKRPPL